MSMLQRLSDAEVIASSAADTERFGEMFDRYFPVVHRYVHRRVGRHLADDIAAETFAEAFRRRTSYDGRPDARPWLLGIATNLVRRHHRLEERELRAYARTGVDSVAQTEFTDADSRVDALAASRDLARGLASMRAVDRDVLLLFAWAELSYEEISRALQIPVGTVRSRLSRGRRKLRSFLDPDAHLPQGDIT